MGACKGSRGQNIAGTVKNNYNGDLEGARGRDITGTCTVKNDYIVT
jgi:hypothetical protein